ncbi:unnamed protein product [Paramecium sonneborni]|uniref:Uncharacterized protein n=1 Tax=Paramecium sonneborni TaxID=65129 RepID=A0A8S1PJK9_9CILI|nr:unnamed protein product [Paramecium sonneborni]
MRIAKDGEYPYFHHLKNTIDEKTQKLFDKDVLNEQERNTAADLYIEYNKNIADVNKFLLLEYAVLQNKITKCLRSRCYDDIFKDRQSIRFCVIECTQGLKDADKFVQGQFQQLRDEFQECMEKTNTGQWMISGVFQCYHNLNERFSQLKLNIREEFNYYQ